MHTLYLARHGEAESPARYSHDRERELTPIGKAKLLRTAKRLRSAELEAPHIISSPYVRARRTAEILAAVWPCSVIEFDARLRPLNRCDEALDLLRELDGLHSCVMLVSHNPLISILAAALSADGRLQIEFEPGAIACISTYRLHPLHAALRWFCSPQMLGANLTD